MQGWETLVRVWLSGYDVVVKPLPRTKANLKAEAAISYQQINHHLQVILSTLR